MTVSVNVLGLVETGNRPWIAAECVAPNVPGHTNEASSAVTFSVVLPDGSSPAAVSSPHADIVGPVAGTKVVDGVTLATTTWYWKMPLIALAGTYAGRVKSTAGFIVSGNFRIETPSFVPFAIA